MKLITDLDYLTKKEIVNKEDFKDYNIFIDYGLEIGIQDIYYKENNCFPSCVNVIDPTIKQDIKLKDFTIPESGYITLNYNENIFLKSNLKIKTTNNIIGFITFKNMYSKNGLLFLSSVIINPNFNGYLSLNVKNINNYHTIMINKFYPLINVKFYEI